MTSADAPAVRSGIFAGGSSGSLPPTIRKIHMKRFNSITQYLGRGTLDKQTDAEMEQTALPAEAKMNRKQ